MFNIGDLIIYSAHGVCRIDDICKNTYFGVTKDYYVLHPMENYKLKISIPVDNDKVIMQGLLNRNEAEEILQSFKLPGVSWIELDNQRTQMYYDVIRKGNRREIANIANTLMRKKNETKKYRRKFQKRDDKLLTFIQSILFEELALALNTTSEVISKKITKFIIENEY
ncbi:CarD family transcriptional regulator [Clostridium pascui]|uniref:CarD family transcriptional regulator n=1 Tax=Clostridium pascui TaxID=46609 RepID=UPI00195B8238|nr:CarD family transcriptional regulator [Clostridium pascui]MBM7869112.1 CarD family transcriptional regulator [Clostridium pascui]